MSHSFSVVLCSIHFRKRFRGDIVKPLLPLVKKNRQFSIIIFAWVDLLRTPAFFIDVTHHQINVFLRVGSDISALGNDAADELVVHLAGSFFTGRRGITGKNMGAPSAVFVKLQSFRVRELTAIVTEQDRKQFQVGLPSQEIV